MQDDSSLSKLRAFADLAFDKLFEIGEEFREIDERCAKRDAANAVDRERQKLLREKALKIYEGAEILGLDLRALVESENSKTANAVSQIREVEPEAPKPPTVKEFVLEIASAAYPSSVKASQIRKALLEQCGQTVHDKTVGMTLYRLLKKGYLRREGINWFFIPEEQRNLLLDVEDDKDRLAAE